MNATQTPIQSTETSEASRLRAECRQRGIPLLGRDPGPAEIIPRIEERLASHQKNPARFENHASRALADWKSTNDDLTRLLAEARAAEKVFSAQNAARTESSVDHQHSTDDNEVRTSDNEVRKGEKILTSSENLSPNITSNPAPKPESTAAREDQQTNDPHDDSHGADDPESDTNDDEDDADDEEEVAEDEDEEDIDLADYLFDESLDAAIDLKEYLSGRSPLDKLEPRVQQAILRVMEDHKPEHVVEAIAEPPPIGLGVKTSQASLYRFRDRYTVAKEESRKTQHTKAVEDLLAKANDSDEAFQAAVQCVLKARLLNTASEPSADLETINSLITALSRLRKQTLAERKQAFAEKTKCARS